MTNAGEVMPALRPKHAALSDQDRAFWSFRPVQNYPVPSISDNGPARGDIDRFTWSSLSQYGLKPAPEADRITLIRRATFDLHGLPPTPQEIDAFLADSSPTAYEKLIDRLLASPRYGERWARHWLDLVRYAESDGFKQDSYRPGAWPYRDYVIKSFNEDKPYDRFITEQLAGDEIAPDDPNVIVATGYLRHTPYEYNQRDVPKQWSEMLNDVTDVTADAFLGLSMGCARCHDHKFDPISQADYFRLQAFFTPMLPRDDLALATPEKRAEAAQALAAWDAKRASVRAELAALEAPFIQKTAEIALAKFPLETQAILAMEPARRSPLQQQLAALAYKQVYDPDENPQVAISDKTLKDKQTQLKKQLTTYDAERPAMPVKAQSMTDVGAIAPPTFIPGDASHPLDPGCPAVLDRRDLSSPSIHPSPTSTGRRTALAKWITDPKNPLTARVIVNRIWQYHFGKGIVATSSDFGRLGTPPSHPELLDWLANRFIQDGWSFKAMHRLIMTSATYRQASVGTRRLDAEQLRDAMLAVSGELSFDAGGPPAEMDIPRRSIYIKVIRNTRARLLDTFDEPESFCSVSERTVTTTPTQSLYMMNATWPLTRATAMAARVKRETNPSDSATLIDAAYRLAYGRLPQPDERANATKLLVRSDTGLTDLCHVLLSSNEFLYVD